MPQVKRLPLFREILGYMCIVILCKPDCAVSNFEFNVIISNQAAFST